MGIAGASDGRATVGGRRKIHGATARRGEHLHLRGDRDYPSTARVS